MQTPIASPRGDDLKSTSQSRLVTLASVLALVAGAALLVFGMCALGFGFLKQPRFALAAYSLFRFHLYAYSDMVPTLFCEGFVLAGLGAFGLRRRRP